MKMKNLFAIAGLCALAACESDYRPPAVTADTLSRGKASPVDLDQAGEGRRLYAYRCIECHTLPPVWNYRLQDWPGIVDSMAHRSSLKPAERDAIIAYIKAVRSPQAARLKPNEQSSSRPNRTR